MLVVVGVLGGAEAAGRAAVDPLVPLNTDITEEVEAADEAVDITKLRNNNSKESKRNEQQRDLLGKTVRLLQL